jgi:hypothetical protein
MKKTIFAIVTFFAMISQTIQAQTTTYQGAVFSDFKFDVGLHIGQSKSATLFIEPRYSVTPEFQIGIRYNIVQATNPEVNPNDMIVRRGVQISAEYLKGYNVSRVSQARPFIGVAVGMLPTQYFKDAKSVETDNTLRPTTTADASYNTLLATPRAGLNIGHFRIMAEVNVPLSGDFKQVTYGGTAVFHFGGGGSTYKITTRNY